MGEGYGARLLLWLLLLWLLLRGGRSRLGGRLLCLGCGYERYAQNSGQHPVPAEGTLLVHKWITGRTIKANGRNSWQGSPKRQQEKPFRPEGKLAFRMKVERKDDKTVIDTSRTNFKLTSRLRKFRRCQTRSLLAQNYSFSSPTDSDYFGHAARSQRPKSAVPFLRGSI